MQVMIDIPDAIQQMLREQFGDDLPQAAKEALAVAWYQAEKLSIGQVAEFLGVSVYQAEGLMKAHAVDSGVTVGEFEEDRATLRRLLEP